MARGWHGGVTSGVTLQVAGRQTTAIRGTEDGWQSARREVEWPWQARGGFWIAVITTRIGAVGGTRGRHARISAKLRGAVAMGGMYESIGKAGRRLPSEPFLEILPIHLNVAENRAEQAKAHALQCTHELAGLDHGSARRRHAATSIRFTPMISTWRGMSAPRAFRSARQSAITSRMFLMASSYVRPCV